MSNLKKLKLHFPLDFHLAYEQILEGNFDDAIIYLDKAIIKFDFDEREEIYPSNKNLSIVY